MRSRFALFAAVALAGSLGAAASALASDWWLVAEGEDGTRLYADASSLHCDAARCRVLERSIYRLVRPDGTREVDDLSGYDCQGRATATLSETPYDDRGVASPQVDARQPNWQHVQSGTVAEASMSFACNFLDQYSDLRPVGTIVVGDRTFVRAGIADVGSAPLAPAVPAPAAAVEVPPAPARPARAALGPGPSVQLAAADSEEAAQAVLDRFGQANGGLMTGLAGRVETAAVDGRRLYRAVVGGFATADAARDFCSKVRASGGACFLRPAAR